MLPWLLALFAGTAAAQQAAPAHAPNAAISLRYSAVLSAYRAYSEQPVQAWRETIDRVGRIGGWRTYGREMAPGGATDDAHGEHDAHGGHHEGHKP